MSSLDYFADVEKTGGQFFYDVKEVSLTEAQVHVKSSSVLLSKFITTKSCGKTYPDINEICIIFTLNTNDEFHI